MSSRRCVVTGAGGFIGGHLIRRLLDEGVEWVRVADIKPENEWHQVHNGVETFDGPYNGDCRDFRVCRDLCKDASEVYQLAADMGGIGFIENNKALCMLSVQVNTSMLLAAQEAGIERFLFTSSACVYSAAAQQDQRSTPLKESDAYPALPEDGYGWEKLFSERLCRHFREDFGLQTRIVRLHNVYGPCFDDQTEVLTARGWVLFSRLNTNDQIASRSPNGRIEHVGISAFQRRHYAGDMYVCESSSVSQAVTPDHAVFATWPTTRETSRRFTPPMERHIVKDTKWDRARMIFSSYGVWTGEEMPDTYTLPECRMVDGRRLHSQRAIKMKDWFEFSGWFISKGCAFTTPSNYVVNITQKPGAKSRKIVSLLKRMGYEPYLYGRDIKIHDKQLFESVAQFNRGAHAKRIPRWMLMAPKTLLEILFRALMDGDGDAAGRRYSTVSHDLADDMSELCLKLGRHAWIGEERWHSADGGDRQIWRVHISARPRLYTRRHHRTIQKYNGMVYDVTLEKHHVMLVRRNGKPIWSGNCGTWCGGREKAPAAICRKVIAAERSGSNEIEIWGDGTQTRSFMWIGDCVDGLRRIMDSDIIEPINLGSAEGVTINQLVDIAEQIGGVKLQRRYLLDAPRGVAGRNSDNTLIQSHLGWEPKTPLRIGMQTTYRWIEQEFDKMKKPPASTSEFASAGVAFPGDGCSPESRNLDTWRQGIPASWRA